MCNLSIFPLHAPTKIITNDKNKIISTKNLELYISRFDSQKVGAKPKIDLDLALFLPFLNEKKKSTIRTD